MIQPENLAAQLLEDGFNEPDRMSNHWFILINNWNRFVTPMLYQQDDTS